jgi:membrane protein DedA with SNARE-associated domain
MIADLSIVLLTGLHGVAATVLICALLFIDEAGVPLFVAPNEVLLMLGGLLIASGGVSPAEFPPLAVAALLAGSFTGYSWARVVGPRHLRTIAARLRARRHYERAVGRVAGASAGQLLVARLIPGIRVYVSLAAGAGEMPRGRFLRGNVPAVAAWAAGTMAIGFVAGIPVIHFLGYVQNLALSGAVFIVLGFAAWRAVRRAPTNRDPGHPGPFSAIRRPHRYAVAAAIDSGIVATLTAGIDLIVLAALHVHIPFVPAESVFEPLTIVASVALFYALASRRSHGGRTAGERLLEVSYLGRRHPQPVEATGRVAVAGDDPGPPAAHPRLSATTTSMCDVCGNMSTRSQEVTM